jgi:hypothetical protein
MNNLVPISMLDSLRRAFRFFAMPLEATITLWFWTLFLWDKSLLVDGREFPVHSIRHDVEVHILPAIFLVADYYLLPSRRVRRQPALDFLVFGGFMGMYSIWISSCYQRNGKWPYPGIEKFGTESRVMGLAAVALTMQQVRRLVLNFTSNSANTG